MFAQSYQAVTIYLQNMKQLLLNATHHCIMNSKHCFGIAVYITNTKREREDGSCCMTKYRKNTFGKSLMREHIISRGKK